MFSRPACDDCGEFVVGCNHECSKVSSKTTTTSTTTEAASESSQPQKPNKNSGRNYDFIVNNNRFYFCFVDF